MSRRRGVVVLCAGLLATSTSAVTGAVTGASRVSATVVAEPGRERVAAASVGRTALRVLRRYGRRMEIVTDRRRLHALRRLPGVAQVSPTPVAYPDEVVSQGVFRTGAASLERVAGGGAGLTIAVLDLGFGHSLDARRAEGELPPADRTELVSFDSLHGLEGRNAFGNPTNHGELVAQTIYDFAPNARYVYVNYRTPGDFTTAVDHLIGRRPDIVIHSNNFLEGPFDGTGPEARAVDRAAAAGILWFNSGGNYARKHWSGPWADADGDGRLDWGGTEQGLFYRSAGQTITFAVSWSSPPGGPVSDLDIGLLRQTEDGGWTEVVGSHDDQVAGAAPAERITGYQTPVDGYFRLAVTRRAGPVPSGPITVFTRELDMPLVMGGSVNGSVPTPADARGAIAVGAVDWRGDRLESYSSQGPTPDGRIKPDLVAPTDTLLAGPSGSRQVGGTSNAAPNAAGAAARLVSALRARGLDSSPDVVRAQLADLAVDLGDAGPDTAFGAGRVRVEVAGPRFRRFRPAGGRPVRGRVQVSVDALDASRIGWTQVSVGGLVRRAPARSRVTATIDTRRYPDGPLNLSAAASDWPGNGATRDWSFVVDNTRPRVRVLRATIKRGRAPRRPAVLIMRIDDAGGGPARVSVRGRGVKRRVFTRPMGRATTIRLGRLRPGRIRLRIDVRDRAGNRTTMRVGRRLRPVVPSATKTMDKSGIDQSTSR